jgi:hypothetical protein
MTTLQDERKMERRFADFGRSIDAFLERSKTAGALSEMKDEIAKELTRLDRRFDAMRAQLRQDLAYTREDLIEASQDELDVWKGRLDELRVQLDLGRMELRDRITPMLDHLDSRLSHTRREIEEFATLDVVDEEDLGYSIKQSMAGLRKEVEEVDKMC